VQWAEEVFNQAFEDFTESSDGLYGYANGVKGPFGLRVVWEPEGDALVIVPGSACQAVGINALVSLISIAERVTRIDVCRDMPMNAVVPGLIRAWFEGRITGSTSFNVQDSRKGRTVYMGSRQSEFMARAYNKRGYDRFEIECKGAGAQAVCKMLVLGMSIEHVWHGLANRWQVKVRGGAHKYREAVESWWSEVVGKMQSVITADKVRSSLHSTVENLKRQWGRIIAQMSVVYEPSELIALVTGPKNEKSCIIWKGESVWANDVGLTLAT